MSDVKDRLQEMMFELGDLAAKASTSEESELAQASLQALRNRWEKYNAGRVISKSLEAA